MIDRLAADLRAAFPGARGFSRRNLQYMRPLATAWPEIVPHPVAQLPWGRVRAGMIGGRTATRDSELVYPP